MVPLLDHDPAEKASLFATYFNEKQSDFISNAPDSCDPQPVLTLLAFGSRELLGYMMELDDSIALDPNGLFLLLFSICAAILAHISLPIYRIFTRDESFPVSWRMANVTPIPETSSSSLIYI